MEKGWRGIYMARHLIVATIYHHGTVFSKQNQFNKDAISLFQYKLIQKFNISKKGKLLRASIITSKSTITLPSTPPGPPLSYTQFQLNPVNLALVYRTLLSKPQPPTDHHLAVPHGHLRLLHVDVVHSL